MPFSAPRLPSNASNEVIDSILRSSRTTEAMSNSLENATLACTAAIVLATERSIISCICDFFCCMLACVRAFNETLLGSPSVFVGGGFSVTIEGDVLEAKRIAELVCAAHASLRCVDRTGTAWGDCTHLFRRKIKRSLKREVVVCNLSKGHCFQTSAGDILCGGGCVSRVAAGLCGCLLLGRVDGLGWSTHLVAIRTPRAYASFHSYGSTETFACCRSAHIQ